VVVLSQAGHEPSPPRYFRCAHLREDRKILLARQRNLRKGKGLSVEDKEDLGKQWDSLGNELVANIANLPLALHWFVLFVSITSMLIIFQVSGEWYLHKRRALSSSVYFVLLTHFTDLGHDFSLINGIATFRGGWRATSLPSVKAVESPNALNTADSGRN
jgi:hypothetical protein